MSPLTHNFDRASLAQMSQDQLIDLIMEVVKHSPLEPSNLANRDAIYRHLDLPSALVDHIKDISKRFRRQLPARPTDLIRYLNVYNNWKDRGDADGEKREYARYHIYFLSQILDIEMPNVMLASNEKKHVLCWFYPSGKKGVVCLNENSELFNLNARKFTKIITHEMGHAYSCSQVMWVPGYSAEKKETPLGRAWDLISYNWSEVQSTGHYFEPPKDKENLAQYAYWHSPEEKHAREFAQKIESALDKVLRSFKPAFAGPHIQPKKLSTERELVLST